ncbi:hypothetical protein PGIGA_G00197910 [Pangasianodon gigas]|uniref:Uncharacterized protein n=1 Tax=Pangasianodon gigas TaxID=30993 RepID=A0ACC5WD16_PANGG|nr:hypothetical protein [Pangasianodon gigas]
MFFRCLLLVLVCLQAFTVAQNYNEPAKCCFSYQTQRIPVKLITAFKETDGQCPKPAVIFTLKSGRMVCADPGDKWVKNIMNKIDQRLILHD